MVTYPMFNITKEIIIFSSQQCHVTDCVTRTRTNYLLEIKEDRAFVFSFLLLFFFVKKPPVLIICTLFSISCFPLLIFLQVTFPG